MRLTFPGEPGRPGLAAAPDPPTTPRYSTGISW
jgi:hypothetical protein